MNVRSPEAGWELTALALSRFLAALDPDGDRAAEKYEELRRAVVRFLDWRGAPSPEEGADLVLDRVVRRLEEGEEIRDVRSYCRGVARLVLLEELRKPRAAEIDLDRVQTAPWASAGRADAIPAECLDRCLGALPADSRRLILRYYAQQKRDKIEDRASMARDLGIPGAALRSRAQRIRNRLEDCVKRCLGRHRSGGPHTHE